MWHFHEYPTYIEEVPNGPCVLPSSHRLGEHCQLKATVSCILVSDENTSSTPMREGGLHYPLSHYLMTSYPNFITDDYNTKYGKNTKGQSLITVYCEFHCNTPSLRLFIYLLSIILQ